MWIKEGYKTMRIKFCEARSEVNSSFAGYFSSIKLRFILVCCNIWITQKLWQLYLSG